MPGSVFHVLSATTPDNTSYEIRPSHWNSAHSVSLNIAGSEVVGAFTNANGVSFGLNSAGQVTASIAPSGMSVSAGLSAALLTSLIFSNANAVSFGLSGSTITASASQPVVSNLLSAINVGANGSTQNLSSLQFGNANLVTFGLNNGTLTASVSQTSLSFSNANNVSFTTVGSSLYASASFPAQTSLSFNNFNNVSFGIAGNALTASASFSQSVQTQGIQALLFQGNVSGAATIVSSGSAYFAGGNNITLSQNGNSITISGANIGGAQTGISGISASGGVVSSGTISFSNANGVTFGIVGNTITASIPNIGGAQTGISGVIVSNATFTSGTVSFVNANGASFGSSGVNGISMSYTVPTQTAQTIGVYAAGNTAGSLSATYDARSLSIYGAGLITVGNSGGSVFISAPATTAISQSIYAYGNTLSSSSGTASIGSLAVSALGNASVGYNNGFLLLSVSAQSAISAVQFSNTIFSNATINFVNTNGFSFLASGAGSIVGSYTVPSVAGLISAVNISAGTTSSNLSALSFGNSNNVSFGFSNGSLTASILPNLTQTAISGLQVSNGTFTSGTVQFSNANGISFGTSGANIITASYTTPSTAGLISAINVSAGTTQSNYSNVVFGNGNGVTFGLSGNTITASVPAVAGAQTAISGIVVSNATFTSGTVSLVNANGISFGSFGANQLSASYTVPSTANLISVVNVSAGANSVNISALIFSNANGVSWGVNGSTITASAGGGSQSNQTIGLYAAGTNTTATTSSTYDARSLSFVGYGIISVGNSGGSVVISGPGTTGVTQSLYVAGNTTLSSSGTASFGSLIFAGSNGVSVGVSNGSVVISGATGGAGGGGNVISAGTNSTSNATVVFSNANNVSFGMNTTGVITASVPAISSLSGYGAITISTTGSTIAVSALAPAFGISTQGNTSGTTGTVGNQIIFAGGNNITLSQSTNASGATVTISGANIGGAQTGISGVSVGGTSYSSGTIQFSNANGFSFLSTTGQGIVGSYTVPTQSNQSIGLYGAGNTTLGSSQTVDARTLSFAASGPLAVGISNGSILFSNNFVQSNQLNTLLAGGNQTLTTSGSFDARSQYINGAGNVSVGYSGGSIVVSASQTPMNIGVSTQGNTGGTTGFASNQLLLVGSNNITLSQSVNGQSATLSIYGPAGIGIRDSVTTATSGSVYFSNANGVSFGLSAGSIMTASFSGVTQSNQSFAVSGTNGSFTFNTLTFANSNSIVFYTTNGSLAASYSNSMSIYAAGANTTGTSSSAYAASALSISGAGIITVGHSGGYLVISGPTTTSIGLMSAGVSGLGNYAGSTGLVSNQIVFVGGNNITLSASTNVGSMTVSIIGGAGGGGGGPAISAGTQSVSSGTIVFSNLNGVSFGMSNSSVLTASVASQTNQTIGAYFYGNSTNASSGTFDARTLNFSATGALTLGVTAGSILMSVPQTSSLSVTGGLSLVTNGSTISIGVATGSVNSFWDPSLPNCYMTLGGQIGAGSVFLFPARPGNFISFSQGVAYANISLSTSSNSSMAGAISAYLGLYTRNGSTLSLASSGSAGVVFTNTSNNSAGSVSGLRAITVPINAYLPDGDYWVAFMSNTNSTNANWFTANNIIQSAMSTPLNGQIGQSTNNSYQLKPGYGVFSTSTAALPASIAFTQITGQGSANPFFAPYINFNNFSV